MGFMDKLKSTAKVVAEQAEKEIKKNFATPQIEGKELTERQKELPSYGTITNPRLQLEEGHFLSLTIDFDNNKLLIIHHASAKITFNSTEKIIEEYSIDDVVELKCLNIELKKGVISTFYCDYKLVLSSEKEIDFRSYSNYITPEEFQTTEWTSANAYQLEWNLNGYFDPMRLHLHFSNKIFDAESKLRINQFYEDRGYLPVFNDNGFIFENTDKNWKIFEETYPINK